MLEDLGAEPILCDVFDAGRLGSVVARAEPDAVINELTDLPQSLNPRTLKEYYAANNRVRREGTMNLLDAASGGTSLPRPGSRLLVCADRRSGENRRSAALPGRSLAHRASRPDDKVRRRCGALG